MCAFVGVVGVVFFDKNDVYLFERKDITMQINELIKSVEQLSLSEFEVFYHKLQTLRMQKVPETIAVKEKKLLKKINTPFSSKKNLRFHLLIAKRDTKSLTKEEYKELLALTTDFENYELRRLKLLAKLAELRKVSLPEVIKIYNIHPKINS